MAELSTNRTCEVKADGMWIPVDLEQAASRHTMAAKRCPACHGQVIVAGGYTAYGVRRKLMHRRSHDGCPLRPQRYCGTPSPHPQAMA